MGNQDKNTLLFIADISGFTRFINETEISHSSHIISELLELVISENTMDLKIAEIEGDAVFFYKEGPIPELKEIVEQSKKMFAAFHEHLKVYARDRICQCGACVGATELGLKFVSHNGDVLFQNIQNRLQLMGKDVTLAHKFLKNNIDISNYILVSDNFKIEGSDLEGLTINKSVDTYDGAGEVTFNYLSLEKVKNQIIAAPIIKIRKQRTDSPLVKELIIEAPIKTVHANLISIAKRPSWKTDVKYDEKLVERVGTSHECLLPQGSVIGHVVDNEVIGDEIIYEEHTDRKNALIPGISEVYHLKALSENSTTLSLEMHIHTNKLLRSLYLYILNNGVGKALKKFADICES